MAELYEISFALEAHRRAMEQAVPGPSRHGRSRPDRNGRLARNAENSATSGKTRALTV